MPERDQEMIGCSESYSGYFSLRVHWGAGVQIRTAMGEVASRRRRLGWCGHTSASRLQHLPMQTEV